VIVLLKTKSLFNSKQTIGVLFWLKN